MFYRESTEKLTQEEIMTYVKEWSKDEELGMLRFYKSYYETDNEQLIERVRDRGTRGKTPNNFVPSGYYSTVVDTMGGYLFQNVKYSGDENVIAELNKSYVEIKDMNAGTNALTYNRGIELVYTVGDGKGVDVKFTSLKTESVILIYNTDIEPELFCAIRLTKSADDKKAYDVDVIYNDLWQYYRIEKGNQGEYKTLIQTKDDKPLLFKENPVIVYKTEIISDKSSFSSVIGYIVALDWILTGNANEIDRLVDALLVLGKSLKPEDLDKMDEMKALMNMKKDDRAEYITKDMSPAFREYVSKLLIQEIHKHSHVVDWYSPDSGLSGAVSAKALKTRLFDMDMFSERIEKVYRIGAEKRIRLIRQILDIQGKSTDDVDITFNRSVPSDFEDKLDALSKASFISNQTKVEKAGLDWEVEKKRLEEENPGIDLIGGFNEPEGFTADSEQ